MNEFIYYVMGIGFAWMFIWAIPAMFFLQRYGLGSDRLRYVDELIGNLSSDPERFKVKHYRYLWPSASGGLFVMYAFFYPLVRHRGKNRTLKFDIVMWLNFLFYFAFFTTYSLGKLGYLNYFR